MKLQKALKSLALIVVVLTSALAGDGGAAAARRNVGSVPASHQSEAKSGGGGVEVAGYQLGESVRRQLG